MKAVDDWTVIVDDDCGTLRAYYVEANTPSQAAAFAERIYNAHHGRGGRVQYVIAGLADLQTVGGSKPPEIIDLMMTAEEREMS